MSKRSANRCLVPAVAILMGCCLGCGTGKYEEGLEQTVKRLGRQSSFAGMFPATQLPDTPVTLQLPRFFNSSALPEDSEAGRLKPPVIELPGLKLTYEGSVTDSGGGQIPFYCYLAVTKENPERTLQMQMQQALPAAIVAKWQEVDCKTPDGGTIRWKKLEGAGRQQDFYYVNKEEKGAFVPMEAKMVLYVRQEGDLLVLIGWRLPTSIEGQIGMEGDFGLDQWASRVAGSLVVK